MIRIGLPVPFMVRLQLRFQLAANRIARVVRQLHNHRKGGANDYRYKRVGPRSHSPNHLPPSPMEEPGGAGITDRSGGNDVGI